MSRSLAPLVFLLTLSLILAPVGADVQIQLYSGTLTAASNPNGINAEPFTSSSTITVTQLGYNFQAAPSPGSTLVLGIYSDSSNYPGSLLGQTTEISPSGIGWFFVNLQTSVSVASNTQYWLVLEENGVGIGGLGYAGSGTGLMHYRGTAYSSSMPSTFPGGASGTTGVFWNLGYAYSTGPPPPPPSDFTISATTTTQTVGAGSTATYSIAIQYSVTLSTTVSLTVTSGCPASVTCTIFPNSVTGSTSVTLSVPTILTTPGGTTSVTVTASSTSPVLSHAVTVQLTVNAPASSPISVHAGATQVVVTVSWTGTGTAPVTLAGPGASPTLTESGAAVYDRTSIPTGSSTPTYIHRVTFTLSPPPSSTQTWTVLISISVPSGYTVMIEVS
ncbi:MAG: hypothetical protein ABSF09_10655 [Candidatus Bathyarchaeia archaeon]